jgi:hypothetical protein
VSDLFDQHLEAGKKSPFMFKYEELPLEYSITWRYRKP